MNIEYCPYYYTCDSGKKLKAAKVCVKELEEENGRLRKQIEEKLLENVGKVALLEINTNLQSELDALREAAEWLTEVMEMDIIARKRMQSPEVFRFGVRETLELIKQLDAAYDNLKAALEKPSE